MKIGVIGSINRDTILLADNALKQGWGGMLYNLVTLSHLMGKRGEIYPVCNIGRDCWDNIIAILSRLSGVHGDYLKKVPEKNNHCFLTYLPDGEKTEILRGGVPALLFNDVAPLLDSDIILINYISGRDINLKSLQKLRKKRSPLFPPPAALAKNDRGRRLYPGESPGTGHSERPPGMAAFTENPVGQ
jgi:hypothetical protein